MAFTSLSTDNRQLITKFGGGIKMIKDLSSLPNVSLIVLSKEGYDRPRDIEKKNYKVLEKLNI